MPQEYYIRVYMEMARDLNVKRVPKVVDILGAIQVDLHILRSFDDTRDVHT